MAFWFGSHPLSLVIRLVHVGAMAFLLGGGLLLPNTASALIAYDVLLVTHSPAGWRPS
ncbi:MAG: hypothetical protein PHQ40_21190 [Anaerolineaceae bacterium]|nr:hypothetical protein [Anaerolineaceae bacterium]